MAPRVSAVRFSTFSSVVMMLLVLATWAGAQETMRFTALEQDKGDTGGDKGQPPTTAKGDTTPPSTPPTETRSAAAPEMLGDLPPPPVPCMCNTLPQQPPLNGGNGNRVPGGGGAAGPTTIYLPGVQTFKVADNNSPRPQDRVFFSFNYFNNILAASNGQMGADVHHINLYQEYLGIEKTFLDGAASLELRVPIDTLTASSDTIPAVAGTHTDVGDLTVDGRYAFYRDPQQDNWLTVGFAVTTPTGPSTLGGIALSEPFHSTGLQPWLGGLWHFGDWFAHGFSSVAVPIRGGDVTFWFNDVGVGYRLYSAEDQNSFLTAVVPTVELHVSDPLDHRSGLLADFDTVDMTFASSFVFGRSSLALGVVVPLTGPRPYDVEAVVQFRVLY
jgi:hypothetical protein